MITKAISPTLPLEKISSPPSSIKRILGLQKLTDLVRGKLRYRMEAKLRVKGCFKATVLRRRASLLRHLHAYADLRSPSSFLLSFLFFNFLYLNSVFEF